MQLIKYEAACRAVAEAKTVDEVKEFLAGADAARAYARQAKNRQLEIDALEIRIRAERRLGEMIIELQKQGHCRPGGLYEDKEIITLKQLGIDSALSQLSQRVALVEEPRFEQEIKNWRDEAPASKRVSPPMQWIRAPHQTANAQRQAERKGYKSRAAIDDFDAFIAPDGRRYADWRIGELRNLLGKHLRAAKVAKALIDAMPAANADTLATVQMIFKKTELMALFKKVFDSSPVDPSDAGLAQKHRDASIKRRRRICEECKREFVMKFSETAGRFCSRDCAFAFQKNRGPVGTKEFKKAGFACVVEGQNRPQ